ncbi:MAG: hypothetical protein ACI9R3_002338 [Verrucomicrobiales bacterium]|jgi:hypothetical protein
MEMVSTLSISPGSAPLLRSGIFVLVASAVFAGASSCAADETRADGRLTLHQNLVEAWQRTDASRDAVDFDHLPSVFWHVFSRFPSEVHVYPSENYFYWQLDIDGRHLTGNLRFPAGLRDEGIVSFAYSERRVLARAAEDKQRIAGRAMLGNEQGISLKKVRRGVYDLGYSDHFVRFHLEDLSQSPPDAAMMRDCDAFVGRTFDESGLRFLLMFQAKAKHPYFFWVLDESSSGSANDRFVEFRPGIWIARRTGFVFREDTESGGRKVLIAVNAVSVARNDYYDGPFDQLPENHADKAQLQTRMIQENPSLKGKIDRLGYYIEDDPPARVALVRYANYRDNANLSELLKAGEASPDWRVFFARQAR